MADIRTELDRQIIQNGYTVYAGCKIFLSLDQKFLVVIRDGESFAEPDLDHAIDRAENWDAYLKADNA